MNRLRIFISYGHDEYLPFAKKVAQELKVKGHEVWFDEERLKPGKDWEVYIENGLDWVSESGKHGRILLIMTPFSVRRPDGYCLNEIAKAIDNRLIIIPVMLVWVSPPLSIYRLQYIDLQHSLNKTSITDNFDSDFSKIYSAIEFPESLEQTGTFTRLQKDLDPLNFEADITFYQNIFVGREWVFDEIELWLKTKDVSRIFLLTGAPGIGKTSLTCQLIQRSPHMIAYHLCQRGNSEKISAQRLLTSIAYQLATQLPEYKNKISSIDIKQCNDNELFNKLLIQPLANLVYEPAEPFVIMIDGLDEASIDGKNSIAQLIASEFDKLPHFIRLIITTRPDKEVLLPLQRFQYWQLKSESERNQADLIAYIGKRLGHKITGPGFDLVLNKIMNKSQGSFLYARYICDQIASKGKIDLNNPKSFPDGMGGVYYGYFSLKFPDKHYYRKYIRAALEVIIAAFEPLTKQELIRFLDWNMDNINDFLQDIGSFLTVNSENKIVPFHISLFDWLEDEEKAGVYFIDSEKGHKVFIENGKREENIEKRSNYILKHYYLHLRESNWLHEKILFYNNIDSSIVWIKHLCLLEQSKAASSMLGDLILNSYNSVISDEQKLTIIEVISDNKYLYSCDSIINEFATGHAQGLTCLNLNNFNQKARFLNCIISFFYYDSLTGNIHYGFAASRSAIYYFEYLLKNYIDNEYFSNTAISISDIFKIFAMCTNLGNLNEYDELVDLVKELKLYDKNNGTKIAETIERIMD